MIRGLTVRVVNEITLDTLTRKCYEGEGHPQPVPVYHGVPAPSGAVVVTGAASSSPVTPAVFKAVLMLPRDPVHTYSSCHVGVRGSSGHDGWLEKHTNGSCSVWRQRDRAEAWSCEYLCHEQQLYHGINQTESNCDSIRKLWLTS